MKLKYFQLCCVYTIRKYGHAKKVNAAMRQAEVPYFP
jgi:hypothetical protein